MQSRQGLSLQRLGHLTGHSDRCHRPYIFVTHRPGDIRSPCLGEHEADIPGSVGGRIGTAKSAPTGLDQSHKMSKDASARSTPFT